MPRGARVKSKGRRTARPVRSAQKARPVAPATPESRPAHDSPCALAGEGAARAAPPADGGSEAQAPPAGPTGPPTLTKAGYFTRPAAAQLALLCDAQLAALSGFAVGRTGYGLIEWEGAVDVRGLDLDAVVIIRHAGVDVYPRGCGLSPPVGSGLNRPATVTLAERGVLAAAAAEQPQRAASGHVELRLQRRAADGARRVWTFAVPLAGGDAALLSTEGSDDDEQLEGPRPAQMPAEEDAMQLDGACRRGGVERPATPEVAQAAPPPALQLASLRHALDDVDD